MKIEDLTSLPVSTGIGSLNLIKALQRVIEVEDKGGRKVFTFKKDKNKEVNLYESSLKEKGLELKDIKEYIIRLSNSAKEIEINFTNVNIMDSAFMGIFISLHKLLKEKSATLIFSNCNECLIDELVVTKLNKIFTIESPKTTEAKPTSV